MMGVDMERFRELYFEEARENAFRLREASAASLPGLYANAVRAAHSIKGSSGAFGFDELIDLGQAIEDLFLHARLTEHLPEAETALALDVLDASLARRERRESPDAVAVTECCQRLQDWLSGCEDPSGARPENG